MNLIERDKQTIRLMAEIYRKGHPTDEDLDELVDYACQRLDKCDYGVCKPACKDCPIHCYSPAMRERVRRIMRYAGPRMLFVSPRCFLRHFLQCIKNKRHDIKQNR